MEDVVEDRRVVTILFCDLVGFTATSERADPEDIRARVAPYFAHLRHAAEAYGGTLEKFIGDAIEAVYGVPHVHEDDPVRAVRAALAMLDEIDRLNGANPALDLKVRIGIHTGEVLARLSPRNDESQGIVTGSPVNLASRLQTVAPEGGVVVSDATYAATKESFEYEPLGRVEVKGISEPVTLWRPTAWRDSLIEESRRHAIPLVGRTEELEVLKQTFARAIRGSSVQGITIVGEPGIGKTRMVVELNRHADALPELVRWRNGRCLPYGEGVSFWALGEIIKAEALIYDSDDPGTVMEKLDRIVVAGPDREWFLQRLRPLVGLSASEAPREENFTAWRRFLEQLCENAPSVFVFEDLQWADDAMLAFVEHLPSYAEGVPMLVLATARPELYERRPTWWGGVPDSAIIRLSPLSTAESVTFASNATGHGTLPSDVGNLVAERSGGNPLYAEELVGLMLERNQLRHEGGSWTFDTSVEVPVPGGIRSLISARLDTVPLEHKGILANAAVLGEAFWSGALAAMGGFADDAVEGALHDLSRREFVRKARTSSIAGETEYRFWHSLVREVAYQQIPRAVRAERHRSAAAWLETVAAERIEDSAELLAHHYTTALELAQSAHRMELIPEVRGLALRFLRLAGDRAMGLGAPNAETFYRQALDLVPSEADAGGDRMRGEILLRLSMFRFREGNPHQAVDLGQRALQAVRSDPVLRAEAHQTLAWHLAFAGDARAGAEHAEAALRTVEQMDAHPWAATILATVGLARFVTGLGVDRDLMDRSFAALDHSEPLLVSVSPFNTWGGVLKLAGEFGAARARLLEANRMARERGERSSAISALFNLTELECWTGDWGAAAAYADDCSHLADEAGTDSARGIGLYCKSLVAAHVGDLDAARQAAELALGIAMRGSSPVRIGGSLAVLGFIELSVGNARKAHDRLGPQVRLFAAQGLREPSLMRPLSDEVEALVALGELDEADEVLRPFEQLSTSLDRPWGMAVGGRARAMLLAAKGKIDDAVAEGERALTHHDRVSEPFQLGRTQLAMGRIYALGGDADRGRRRIEDALGTFEGLGARVWAQRARSELDGAADGVRDHPPSSVPDTGRRGS